jgi:hypothetical protein
MRQSLRRAAAGLSLAACLSLIHVPAAHAKAIAAHGRGRHVQTKPADHGLVTTLWSFLVTVVTGTPPADQPTTLSTTTTTVSSNADVGATADPNGL